MTLSREKITLVVVMLAITGMIVYLQSLKPARMSARENSDIESSHLIATSSVRAAEKAKKWQAAKEISTPNGFVNTDKITISELVGKKVILVDFWTYSCINCQRTTPYLNAWYEKYRDQGLEIIGIHTPEFAFEENYENVKRETEKARIAYPVVLDNDYSTWNAYENRYWPHKYLIDIDGFMVYDHVGEGAYEETERKIQEALEERKQVLQMQEEEEMDKTIVKPENPMTTNPAQLGSPEIYFGALRNEQLANGKSGATGPQQFTAKPSDTILNGLYLGGTWDITREYAENTSGNARIILRYAARSLYFVGSSDTGVVVRILRDGKPLRAEADSDILKKDGSSSVFIQDARLYQFIDDPDGYGEHTLEMIIEKPGLRAFTFTFG